MIRIVAFLLLLAALATMPARGQVLDVTAAARGERAVLAVHLAASPTSARAAPSADGIVVEITGALAGGVMETAPGGLVQAVRFTPSPQTLDPKTSGSQTLRAEMIVAVPVLSAEAWVSGDRVMVGLRLAEAAPYASGPSPLLGPHGARVGAPLQASAPGPRQTPRAPERNGPAPPAAAPPAAAAPMPAKPEPDGPLPDAVMLLTRSVKKADCDAAAASVAADPWMLDEVWTYGACHAKAGDYPRAAEAFQRLLSFDPTDQDAVIGLGAVRLAEGDATSAQRLFDEALSAAITDGEAARARAFAALLG